MACGGCNTSTGLTKDQVENLINKFIDDGKLQAGLKDCDGAELPKGTKLVLCSAFADMIKELIEKGTIDVVSDVKVEDGKIVVVDGTGKETKLATPFVSDLAFDATTNKLKWVQDGKEKEATLPYTKAAVDDKEVVLTLPDGSTVALPKAGEALTVDSFDHTIQKDANVPGKFGVKVDPDFAKKLKDDAVNTANDYTDDKLKELAENGAKVYAEKPIQGTGLKTDPLTLKLSKDFKVNPDGTLVLSGGVKEATSNLNNGIGVMGMSTFYGVVNNTNGNTEYVVGVPTDIKSLDHQQTGTTAIGQLASGQNYDFNGWQIATPAQVDQWLIGEADSVWHRTNESGMNTDGSLKDPNNWGVWTRESNVNIPVQQFQKAIQDILALETLTANLNQRLTAIENDIVTLWDASGTVKLGRILKAK